MPEAYNRGVLFVNIPGTAAREISKLGLEAEIGAYVEKAQTSARRKYLATNFLLSSYSRW